MSCAAASFDKRFHSGVVESETSKAGSGAKSRGFCRRGVRECYKKVKSGMQYSSGMAIITHYIMYVTSKEAD
jgi:hypothetical protein